MTLKQILTCSGMIGLYCIVVCGLSIPVAKVVNAKGSQIEKQWNEDTRKYKQQQKEGFLQRVEFDGHLWVVRDYGQGGGIAHHPDCQCTKKQPTKE